ncbi:MAG: hypothetical protein ABL995_18110 [Bryobacteraceae bacterium]
MLLRVQDSSSIPVAEDIASAFRGTTALFTPAFINDGHYTTIYEGDTSFFINQHAELYAQAILLGNLTIVTGTDPQDVSLHVVTASSDAKLYLASDAFQYHRIQTSAKGVDFNRERAIAEAIRELTARITTTLRSYLP